MKLGRVLNLWDECLPILGFSFVELVVMTFEGCVALESLVTCGAVKLILIKW